MLLAFLVTSVLMFPHMLKYPHKNTNYKRLFLKRWEVIDKDSQHQLLDPVPMNTHMYTFTTTHPDMHASIRHVCTNKIKSLLAHHTKHTGSQAAPHTSSEALFSLHMAIRNTSFAYVFVTACLFIKNMKSIRSRVLSGLLILWSLVHRIVHFHQMLLISSFHCTQGTLSYLSILWPSLSSFCSMCGDVRKHVIENAFISNMCLENGFQAMPEIARIS